MLKLLLPSFLIEYLKYRLKLKSIEKEREALQKEIQFIKEDLDLSENEKSSLILSRLKRIRELKED